MSPRGTRELFSQHFASGSFSIGIFKVHCEEPNLGSSPVSLSCFSAEYSGVESDNETEPVPVAPAGCWTFPLWFTAFHLNTDIKSSHILHEMPHCILVPVTI